MNEQWLPVPGWEGLYDVSGSGQIRSLRTGLTLKQCIKNGYKVVKISRPGEKRTYRVHRLVLSAFVGPCPEGMDGCHNNGVRDDNRLENLRWDTRVANVRDALKHGTHYRGGNRPRGAEPKYRCAELGHDVTRLPSGGNRCRTCERKREQSRPHRKRDRKSERARAEARSTQKLQK